MRGWPGYGCFWWYRIPIEPNKTLASFACKRAILLTIRSPSRQVTPFSSIERWKAFASRLFKTKGPTIMDLAAFTRILARNTPLQEKLEQMARLTSQALHADICVIQSWGASGTLTL